MTTAQRTTAPAPTGADRGRQVGVTIAEVFCIVGTLVGVGVIGTRVEESSGGALAADADEGADDAEDLRQRHDDLAASIGSGGGGCGALCGAHVVIQQDGR